ncbi:MAG: DUF1579 domain-containing protein [Aquabacterium sp.]|jgi:hypothetical protein|nr:DUF1579 domain-containing protein [Aquabacterium sp.]
MAKHLAAALPYLLVALAWAAPAPVLSQGRPDPTAATAAQVEAMKVLAGMNGVWKGTAWTLLPSGEKKVITQTERIGPMLQGTLKVVEGRGYDDQGALVFNAFGVVSFNPVTRVYSLRSYAQGRAGDFVLTPNEDGYVWEIPAGPATIRYTAVLKQGTFREIGERLMAGAEPLRIFEMNLTRVADTDWPSAGAISPK